jgi:lysyl-tRNA synthetase class 2
MRPEKNAQRDSDEKFVERGIPAEWIAVLRKMSLNTLDALSNLAPGKLHNDLCGFNKKNRLGLPNPSQEEVKNWIQN